MLIREECLQEAGTLIRIITVKGNGKSELKVVTYSICTKLFKKGKCLENSWSF